MKFEFTAGSKQLESSLYTFKDDEIVSTKAYSTCMEAPYVSIVSYIKGAAEAGGLQLDHETLERWKRVCSAMYFIDDFIDTAPDRQVAHSQFIAGMRYALTHDSSDLIAPDTIDFTNNSAATTQLVPTIILLKNSMQPLPDSRIARLVDAACDINVIALAKTTVAVHDNQHYLSLLQREAIQTATLLTESVSESTHRQPQFYRFADWCRQTLAMAILADSAVDLHKDYRENITSVVPTPILMARLALSAMAPAVRLATHHPKSTIGSLLERLRFGHML